MVMIGGMQTKLRVAKGNDNKELDRKTFMRDAIFQSGVISPMLQRGADVLGASTRSYVANPVGLVTGAMGGYMWDVASTAYKFSAAAADPNYQLSPKDWEKSMFLLPLSSLPPIKKAIKQYNEGNK